jgi:hypothetical protein
MVLAAIGNASRYENRSQVFWLVWQQLVTLLPPRQSSPRLPPSFLHFPPPAEPAHAATPSLLTSFSKLEVIFCAFLAENKFVNALILFIRARPASSTSLQVSSKHVSLYQDI